MRSEDFVHLHCHSTYSLLDALPSPEEIVLRAKELGQTAVALTDKGYTYGLIEFYQYAQKNGIKPILGMEAFVAARTRLDKESGTDTKSYPLVLLAASQEGYQNLLKLATEAALSGMYYRPRIDRELMEKYGKGLIALTGQLGGAIPQAALAGNSERVALLTEEYRQYFGNDNVYFELMDLPNIPGQAEVNQQLIRLGKELSVPTVATCCSFYCRPEDAEVHDVLLCIQKNANIHDTSRFSLRDSNYAMRATEDMMAAFSHAPEALANTRVIADRCNVDFTFGAHHIPRFPVPDGRSEEQELTRLAETGFVALYPLATPALRDRLQYELTIINQVGFAGYFLIVADFVQEAKRRCITVGPGRGSAAGSMVSYCLGITGIDPIEHGLLFERFLNPERISLPDIDLDFADTRRDEVLEYVREKYGADHVVQICTFGTLAARAAVKDVGRAYGIPFLEMNALVKLIPERPGTKLKDALETAEMKTSYESNELYRKIIDAAIKLEGKARHVSVHACGVIITPEPSTQYTALQRAPKDEHTIITQYTAKPLEALGLLKMDFLGLMNLTVIQTTLRIVERTRGITIAIAHIPIDDALSFTLLQRGDTTGVFQLESPGMRRYLKQLKPTIFGDITAMVSLYRPGPMEWISSFIKRKHGSEQVRYIHDDLRPILEPTYGIGVYQEQILQIAQVFAGFSLGEADILRRAIGKKIKKELDAQREKFIQGAVRKGYKQALAESIFTDVITPFAGYGFNKSHAVGYARIAYETAYLKAHYPAEFMAALLSSDSQVTERVMIEIEECRSMGIDVLPPDINESFAQFTVITPAQRSSSAHTDPERRWAIRFGLSAIKGVGDSSVSLIIAERERSGPFASIEDFARRVSMKILNKKLLESLTKSGAFDTLGERRALLEHYESIVSFAKASGGHHASQADLFSTSSSTQEQPLITFPVTTPATVQQKLQWEKETLGMYVSSHPLAGLKKYIGKKAQLIADFRTKDAGRTVTIAGIEEGRKELRTKKGESMAILTLEDPTGKMEVTLFPRTYAQAEALLGLPDTVLVVAGTLDYRGGVLQMRANAIKRATLSTMITKAKAEGFFDEEEAKRGLRTVQNVVDDHEKVELLDDEGNVISGETVHIASPTPKRSDVSSLGQWIVDGMPTIESLQTLGFDSKSTLHAPAPSTTSVPLDHHTHISIHTVSLPKKAPRQLLLDLKNVLQTFPGHERIQLTIGDQHIALPITVAMSPILEQKIAEVIARYTAMEPSS